MSGTEEAAGTRPSPSLTRCRHCSRILELEGQVTQTCTYCGMPQREVNHWYKIAKLVVIALPYLFWIVVGLWFTNRLNGG
jgi:RNA polymerase subunit RPABC4/transcription elongation factor Spt4